MKQPPHPSGLRLSDVSKRFGVVQALDSVSLELDAGCVTALMGENGAGKSTLLKIISGDYQPDSGTIELDGHEVRFATPSDSRRAGIRVISQEPEIVPFVSVAENIYIGALRTRAGIFRSDEVEREATARIEELGLGSLLNARTIGTDLSPAQRQLVEIVRALIDNPQVICFDEPTSSLSDAETEILFTIIRKLRDQGRAIAYVSHRMKEVFQISDKVTVLRDGKLVGTLNSAEADQSTLVQMMVGRDLSSIFQRQPAAIGEVALRLDDVTTDQVHNISLEVRHGEVVALAGLVGAGRSELALAIAGDLPIRSGAMWIDGAVRAIKSPADAIKYGIGLAPEERKADALILEQSVAENITVAILPELTHAGVVNRRREKNVVDTFIKQLGIRTPSPRQLVKRLSGGNQQKVVLSRWLAKDTEILLLDEPTRGIDVGAKYEIYRIIEQLAAQGKAILMISSELPEVLSLADRIVVMKAGTVSGTLTREKASERRILELAMTDTSKEQIA